MRFQLSKFWVGYSIDFRLSQGYGFFHFLKIYSSLPLDIAFQKIRGIGKVTEREMFETTSGVNTHKGMIFLMGIAVGATARALYEKRAFRDIQKIICEMTKDILKDFENIDRNKKLTHGEKLFLEYGFTGIRGEIKNGLDIVFNGSLRIFSSAFEKTNNINFSSLHTLIYLMSEVWIVLLSIVIILKYWSKSKMR